MTKDITILPVGTQFKYKGEHFKVVSRDEYPFIEAKCIDQPNEHRYHMLFTNFEKVEVAEDTKTYKQTFVEVSKNYFAMKEELV